MRRTCGFLVVFIRITQHQCVLATAERVPENSNGVEVYIGVGTLRLTRTRTIKVPDGVICNVVIIQFTFSSTCIFDVAKLVSSSIFYLDKKKPCLLVH